MAWNPISLDAMMDLIAEGEAEMEQDMLASWNLIKTAPEKWDQESYRDEEVKFWVVGLAGKTAIYYQDIEEGFNISGFTTYGHLDETGYEQDELQWTMKKLFTRKAPSQQSNNLQ
jgi:hypothetical protein